MNKLINLFKNCAHIRYMILSNNHIQISFKFNPTNKIPDAFYSTKTKKMTILSDQLLNYINDKPSVEIDKLIRYLEEKCCIYIKEII